MPRRAPHEVRPLSGSKAPAPGGNKPTRGYVYGFIVAYFVWSITPAAWLTLALRYYYKGSIFSVPRNAFGRFWCIYSMLEAVFSIYLQIITRRASRKVDPPKADIETLRALLTRALSAGLPPPPELQEDGAPKVNGHAAAGQNGTTKPQAPTTRTSTIGPQSKQGRQGLEALQARSVDEDEAAIRRERLRAWFHYVPLEDVWADNVREWLAWAFTARELKDAQSDPKVRALLDEGLEMVKYRLQWQTIRQGYNPRVKPIRLTIDPVQAMSRPLGYYVVTNGFTQAVITWMQLWHGFRYEKSRQCWFLVKDAERGSRRGATCSLPIMFAHGLGIGLGQYIPMLKQLGKHRDGVVILVQPHISTSIYSPQFLDPPTKDEQAQATIDLLQRKGFNAVTTLSHSNGTMVLGWLLRTKPEMFVRNVLVDPVSFCLWEGSVCYSFVYRKWSTFVEILLGYFVGREIGIAHTIGRRFIWFDMVLWADELPSPDKEHLHIVFGEKDLLVDVQGSVSYLRNEGIPDECMSIMETYQHGQALMHHGEGMRIALGYAGLRT